MDNFPPLRYNTPNDGCSAGPPAVGFYEPIRVAVGRRLPFSPIQVIVAFEGSGSLRAKRLPRNSRVQITDVRCSDFLATLPRRVP